MLLACNFVSRHALERCAYIFIGIYFPKPFICTNLPNYGKRTCMTNTKLLYVYYIIIYLLLLYITDWQVEYGKGREMRLKDADVIRHYTHPLRWVVTKTPKKWMYKTKIYELSYDS